MLHETMQGIRPEREIYNYSWNLAAKMEELRVRKQQFSGASLDRRNFFDLLEHDICDNLLKDLGAPTEALEAEAGFYDKLQYRYRVGDAVRPEYRRRRGFVQGCSWSLDAALTIMTIWTKAV